MVNELSRLWTLQIFEIMFQDSIYTRIISVGDGPYISRVRDDVLQCLLTGSKYTQECRERAALILKSLVETNKNKDCYQKM